MFIRNRVVMSRRQLYQYEAKLRRRGWAKDEFWMSSLYRWIGLKVVILGETKAGLGTKSSGASKSEEERRELGKMTERG